MRQSIPNGFHANDFLISFILMNILSIRSIFNVILNTVMGCQIFGQVSAMPLHKFYVG